ncbi:GntR family transcriptional regulator [Herbiconiux flava]|uniref:DNA-binding GntR family transcriptional regulator n=1 Tax=Herbiconiux flava TaxID=881268 RepID=A0A852SJV6_9MICO|nr:GntR family transcriptional regulator [Herbiconiux flava]NYD69723.1 DNA-binding GntR family transcriptional regulator [Herbiconiux flava]GLK16470.1 GntR family transcriptional regulator [Herbiconiux flava]
MPRAENAYAALREAIMENALKPGTKLPESDLGEHFGVSRTLIRAALARLAGEGLVDIGKTKSATVAQPSREEALDAFEVRRALEREVVRLVALRWSDEGERILSTQIDEERLAADEGDHKRSVRLGAEFHMLLAGLTGNALLRRYLEEVVGRTTLILAVYGQAHPQHDSLAEHVALVDALRAGDGDEAQRLVDAHIAAVEQRALAQEAGEPDDLAGILSRFTQR